MYNSDSVTFTNNYSKYLRLSGKKKRRTAWIPAGTAPRPTIHRHPPCRWKKPAPIPYAMTWPRVIITTLIKRSDEVKEKCVLGYILQNNHPSTLTGGRQLLNIQWCNACSQTNPDANQKSSTNLVQPLVIVYDLKNSLQRRKNNIDGPCSIPCGKLLDQ